MRMWMVDPRVMCRRHLLGEHVEHHMFVGTIKRSISVEGYLRDNLLEPLSLFARHEALVREMATQGYRHASPLPAAKLSRMAPGDRETLVDGQASLKELLRRCPECRARYEAVASGAQVS